MSLLRASATIGSYTLISRLLGFVRDMMIASFLGAGLLSDAFLASFKLPNYMRQLFAEGAFNSAFVPLYASTRAKEGPEAAKNFAQDVHAVLLLVLILVCVLAEIFTPYLVMLMSPGFEKDPVKFQLTVLLTRITFPYILFISLVSLQGGILNSIDKFAAVAATPIIMNICLISAMLMVTLVTPTPAHALAIGVSVSGVAQYLWLYYFCRKGGVSPCLIRPRMTDNVRKLFRLIGPATLGSSVTQINLIINAMIASLIPGAVSILYYAVRVSELPFGVIGIAVSTALLPMLSRQLREGKTGVALHTQNRALELSLLFGLPAAVALMVIPYPIVAVIYQHGAFTVSDTEATYKTLIAFAIGLPASLAVKIFASTFYANHDTKTPVKIAMISVAVNLFFNLLLMHWLAYVGLALSTSISGWVNVTLLALALRKRSLFVPDTLLRLRLTGVFCASLVMGAALFAALMPLALYFQGGLFVKILALSALIIVGALVYGVALFALRVLKPAQIKEYFVKRTA